MGRAAVQHIAQPGGHTVARSAHAARITALRASATIDHERTDCAAAPHRYDLVMHCVGARDFRSLCHLVRPGGPFLAVAGGLSDMLARPRGGVRCVTGYVPESREVVAELVAATAAVRRQPVIGTRFPFTELPAAHALVDTGRKRGSLVIECAA